MSVLEDDVPFLVGVAVPTRASGRLSGLRQYLDAAIGHPFARNEKA